MTARRALELLCRNRRFWRRMPAGAGRRPLLVSPDAALRWLKPGDAAFDPAPAAFAALAEPGAPAWDVGASVGEFALAAAHRSRAPVVAVEADPFLVGLVAASVAANPDLELTVVNAAVSDREGTEPFLVAGRGRNLSGLARAAPQARAGRPRKAIDVPAVTLDALLGRFPAPALVKIDVEGGELLALAGAERLLAEVRPTIVLEVRAETAAAAAAIFARFHYAVEGEVDLVARPLSDRARSGSLPRAA